MSSLLLFGVLYAMSSSRARALEIANEITRDLRESEAGLAEAQRMAHLGNWALDPQTDVATPAPHLAESREYWALTDGNQLKRGFSVQTTAPGAVIRISPAAGNGVVDPGEVRVMKNGRLIPEPQTFQRKANTQALRQAGMDVPDGSAVMQLAGEHGQGRFQVILPKAIRERREWDAGTRLLVEETADGVLLKRVPAFAATRPEEVFGMLPHREGAKSVEEMDAAVLAEARRHAGG